MRSVRPFSGDTPCPGVMQRDNDSLNRAKWLEWTELHRVVVPVECEAKSTCACTGACEHTGRPVARLLFVVSTATSVLIQLLSGERN